MIFSNMKLWPVESLRPHEQINKINLELLTQKINEDGRWFIPVIIDKDTGIIMDGHHRYHYAVNNGLRFIPCYAMSYRDSHIKICHWRTNQPFNYKNIIEKVNSGGLYPAKTTRHVFDELFDTIDLHLKYLM